MTRTGLLLLVAVLVGFASDGAGIQHFGQALEALTVPQIRALSAELIGQDVGLLEWPRPGALGRAVLTGLLTMALGLAFLRLSWWAGLLVILIVGLTWCALVSAGASLPPDPTLFAALVAYGFARLARWPGRSEASVELPAGQADLLMPALAARSGAAILTFDRDGLIRSCNGAAEIMFGLSRHELLDAPIRQLLAGDQNDLLNIRTGADGVSRALRARHRDGHCLDVAVTLGTMAVGDGDIRLAVFQDVGELAKNLQAQPLHDTLTGLPKDVLLGDRVDQALLAAERAGQPLALLVIHVRMLRMIRDTLGDDFADRLLDVTVGRLRDSLRRSDTVARIGDAEFGLLLPSPTNAEMAGQKAAVLAGQLHQALLFDGLEAHLEVNVGVATYPHDGRTTDELRRQAELAMVAARRAQRTVCACSDAGAMPISEEMLLVDQLRAAIEGDRLFLEYLPKVALCTGRLDGVEALVRWQHPERGVIPAERFVALAERHSLILPLTLRVIALAVRQLRSWQDEGRAWPVAINLSVGLLQDPQFPMVLERICSANRGRAQQLLLEISEQALDEHSSTILHVANKLKQKGAQLSLDNFGTGALSLPLLQKLPIVELKIDRSLVREMARDQDAVAVVRSAMSLAGSLGLRVVAVGVEDDPTLDQLAELGCTHVQGYHVGPPMVAERFREWLAKPSSLGAVGERRSAEPEAA